MYLISRPAFEAWPTRINRSQYPMTRDTLCTEEEISELVHRFYDAVRRDPELGPIFEAHIHDWNTHLATMVRFWSSLMLGAGTYEGTPMPKHVALPGLTAQLFEHWLGLFQKTTAGLANQELATRANQFAGRIARSLWFGYQLNNAPNRPPSDLHHG